jgi:hypothetical protein
MLVTISNKIQNIKKFAIQGLPDKTRIFISALWFWVYVAFYLNKLIGCMLGVVLHYTPDSCIIFHPKLLKENKDAPKIVEARLGTEPITNKLSMLINNKWDKEICENGGLNLKEILCSYPSLSTSVIWISYLFDLDKIVKDLDEEEIGKRIKYMLINISDKAIYRAPNLEESEDILFGEVPF